MSILIIVKWYDTIQSEILWWSNGAFCASKLWNSLPQYIKCIKQVDKVKFPPRRDDEAQADVSSASPSVRQKEHSDAIVSLDTNLSFPQHII